MNVKIKNQDLRFKITEEELSTLLAGHLVHTKADMLDKTLVASINPAGRSEGMEAKLVLDESEAYLNLLVPSAQLQALSDMGANRDGLKQKTDTLSITLQVDMPEACHT
jgi:hypothetical protein